MCFQYIIQIGRDCLVNNFRTGREREMYEPLGFFTPANGSLYAPWISKNGFPSPPRPLLHRTCVLVLELALLSLFSILGQAPQPPLSYCWTQCKGIVRKNPLKVTVNDERKTPRRVACGERESNCSRNSGTRHHRRVSSHLQFGYFGPNHVTKRWIVLFGCQSVGVHQWHHIQWDGTRKREYNWSEVAIAVGFDLNKKKYLYSKCMKSFSKE